MCWYYSVCSALGLKVTAPAVVDHNNDIITSRLRGEEDSELIHIQSSCDQLGFHGGLFRSAVFILHPHQSSLVVNNMEAEPGKSTAQSYVLRETTSPCLQTSGQPPYLYDS